MSIYFFFMSKLHSCTPDRAWIRFYSLFMRLILTKAAPERMRFQLRKGCCITQNVLLVIIVEKPLKHNYNAPSPYFILTWGTIPTSNMAMVSPWC